MVLGSFGWFWLILAGFGWLWVVLAGFGRLCVLKLTVSNNTSYDFKKMGVQKVMNDCILKSTETTKVIKNDGVAIFITDEELNAFSYEKTLKQEVVPLILKHWHKHTYALFAALL